MGHSSGTRRSYSPTCGGAYAPHHARRFILEDTYGGRGTVEAPGLMAALDTGAGCHGLCYRIAAEAVEHETEILFSPRVDGSGL